MGLRSLSKKTGILILSGAFLMSAMPPMEVLAYVDKYPFIYDDSCAQDENYMALTEVPGDYTVLPGDSLWKISEQLFGDGNCYVALADANQDILTDPDLIYPGMRLNVSRTGYIRRASSKSIQMIRYSMEIPDSWRIGCIQSGEAFANVVMMMYDNSAFIACLIQDKREEVSASVLDWSKCAEQIAAYAEENYREQVTNLHFEHYHMEEQGDTAGELYLYSYNWHISPTDYPDLICHVCIGLKLTENIQAEFVGYTQFETPGGYAFPGYVRYVTASFEEHYNTQEAEAFTVNDGLDISILPKTEWPLEGMYNSFAYIDEYYTALLQQKTAVIAHSINK